MCLDEETSSVIEISSESDSSDNQVTCGKRRSDAVQIPSISEEPLGKKIRSQDGDTKSCVQDQLQDATNEKSTEGLQSQRRAQRELIVPAMGEAQPSSSFTKPTLKWVRSMVAQMDESLNVARTKVLTRKKVTSTSCQPAAELSIINFTAESANFFAEPMAAMSGEQRNVFRTEVPQQMTVVSTSGQPAAESSVIDLTAEDSSDESSNSSTETINSSADSHLTGESSDSNAEPYDSSTEDSLADPSVPGTESDSNTEPYDSSVEDPAELSFTLGERSDSDAEFDSSGELSDSNGKPYDSSAEAPPAEPSKTQFDSDAESNSSGKSSNLNAKRYDSSAVESLAESKLSRDNPIVDVPSARLDYMRSESPVRIPLDSPESAEVVARSEKVRQDMECPVCLKLAVHIVCPCPNGHAFCIDCACEIRQDIVPGGPCFCPMCRAQWTDISAGAARVAELTRIRETTFVVCRYRSFGCTEMHAVSTVVQHESTCPYKPEVRCLAVTCRWAGFKRNLYDHVQSTHKGVAVQITGLKLEMTLVRPAVQTDNVRRVQLVRFLNGDMHWVVVLLQPDGYIRTGIFHVLTTTEEKDLDRQLDDVPYQYHVAPSVDCGFDIGMIGRTTSLAEDDRGDGLANNGHGEEYCQFKSNTCNLYFSWEKISE